MTEEKWPDVKRLLSQNNNFYYSIFLNNELSNILTYLNQKLNNKHVRRTEITMFLYCNIQKLV